MSISQESHQIIRQTYKRLMKILLVTVIFLFPTFISASNSFYASALNGFNEENFEKAKQLIDTKIWLNNVWDEENFISKFANDSITALYPAKFA